MRWEIEFPKVEEKALGKPEVCECGCGRFHRHGREGRQVRDIWVKEVEVVRWQCLECGRTRRHYPGGVSRSPQSARTKAISVILYGLGVSYDKVSGFTKALGIGIARGTVWNNVHEAGVKEMEKHSRSLGSSRRVEVLGADETVFKVRGEKVTVGVVTDAESGQMVGLEVLGGREAKEFMKWLGKYVRKLGCKVIVTDDHDSYSLAAEELGLQQQLCLSHMRKAVWLRLRKIEAPQQVKEQILQVLKELTPQAKGRLKRLWQKYKSAKPPGKGQTASDQYRLKQLTQELLDKWHKLTLFQKPTVRIDPILGERKLPHRVPPTNNVTERAIARAGKIRYKTMRGLKSTATLVSLCFFLAALTTQNGPITFF